MDAIESVVPKNYYKKQKEILTSNKSPTEKYNDFMKIVVEYKNQDKLDSRKITRIINNMRQNSTKNLN